MNILVVDDEPAYRLLMRNFLMDFGWDVFTAENGEEALAKIAHAKMDLIISDVYMPVMDGIKLHKAVRQIPGYDVVPFLFISAFDDEYTMASVKNPKVEGFVKKGRPIAELKEWVMYLTAPEDKRPGLPPGQSVHPSSGHDRNRPV